MGQSTAVQCFDTEGEKDRFVNIFSFDNYFPYSPAEVRCVSEQQPAHLGVRCGVREVPLMSGATAVAAQVARYIRLMRDYAKACGKRNGELLNYVSTADTARDMDLLRCKALPTSLSALPRQTLPHPYLSPLLLRQPRNPLHAGRRWATQSSPTGV